MVTVKALVRNGRLVVDEPTELPDGTVVELHEADPFAQLDLEQRKKLHAVLNQSRREHEAGQGISAEEVVAELRRI